MRRLLPLIASVLLALSASTACALGAHRLRRPRRRRSSRPFCRRPGRPWRPRATPQAARAVDRCRRARNAAAPRSTAAQRQPPSVRGTPVAASEPLQGLLLDDRLLSPIIGEGFPYRVYLPPDYLHSPQRRYPVLYMLHGAGGNYTEWTDSFLPEQADRMIVAR